MAKGYSARNGFGGSAGMMRQQQQMQQKLAKMQQEMESAQKNVEERSHRRAEHPRFVLNLHEK